MPRLIKNWRRIRNPAFWAWVAFNKRFGKSRGDVGIWHETYLIKPGQYEAIYSGMPPFGLGKVGKLTEASGAHERASDRMNAPAGGKVPAAHSHDGKINLAADKRRSTPISGR